MKTKKAWERFKDWCAEAADHTKLATIGAGYCIRRPKYLTAFIISFLFFLFLMTFFSDGTSNWHLLWSHISIGDKIEMLGGVSLKMLENFRSLYGIAIILICLMQGLVIMLLIFNYRNREKSVAVEGIQNSGIASVISLLALGCPGCGISIFTPILTAVAGASATVLAERIGIFCAVAAFALLFYTFVKLGFFVFITVSARKYKEKNEKNN